MTMLEAHRSKRGDASDALTVHEPRRSARGCRASMDRQGQRRGALRPRAPSRTPRLCRDGTEHDCGRPRRSPSILAAAQAAPGVLLVLTPTMPCISIRASSWLGTPPPDAAVSAARRGRDLQRPACRGCRRRDASSRRRPLRGLVKVTYDEAPAIADLDDPKAGDGMPIDRMTMTWGEAVGDARHGACPRRAASTDAARIQRADRAARPDRRMGGRCAHLVGAEPVDRRHGAHLCRMVRRPVRQGAAHLAVCRRWLRIEGAGASAWCASPPWRRRWSSRPVKLAVTRPQTFTAYGGRPATRQTIALGATREGKLLSIVQTRRQRDLRRRGRRRAAGLGNLDHVCDAELRRARPSCRSTRCCRARCARRARTRAPSASNARSTNSPTRSASIRWRFGCSTTPRRIRTRRSLGRRASCARPSPRVPRLSAGRGGAMRHARCARARS